MILIFVHVKYRTSTSYLDSLVPRPPPFFVLLFAFSNNTRKRKSAKNGEGLVSFIMCVMSGGREVDVGGEGHNHICGCAPPPLRPPRVHLTSHT